MLRSVSGIEFRNELSRVEHRAGDPREENGWLWIVGFPSRAQVVMGLHRERFGGARQHWTELTISTRETIGPRSHRRLLLRPPGRVMDIVGQGPFVGLTVGPGVFSLDVGWRERLPA
jgi:hypothetical protein